MVGTQASIELLSSAIEIFPYIHIEILNTLDTVKRANARPVPHHSYTHFQVQ